MFNLEIGVRGHRDHSIDCVRFPTSVLQ